MTNDPTRPTDPTTPGASPAPAAAAWPAAPEPAPAPASSGAPTRPAADAAPSYIPAGIVARPVPAAPSRRSGLLTGALVVAGLIAAAGIGFAGGRVTAPQATITRGNGQGFGNGQGGANASGRPGNGGFGGAFASGSIAITGSVVAMGDGTITVQPAGGSGTVVIAVPSTATYHAQGAATSGDVAVGTQVEVTVNRGQLRGGPDASGAPGASPATGGAGANGLNLTATDILVTGK